MKTPRDPDLKLVDKLERLRSGNGIQDVSTKVRRSLIVRDGQMFTFVQCCASGDRPWFSGTSGELVRWLLTNGHVRR